MSLFLSVALGVAVLLVTRTSPAMGWLLLAAQVATLALWVRGQARTRPAAAHNADGTPF